jgi:uncharacterized protein
MLKPRGAICNLGCEYCFYLSKETLYPEGNFRMSDEVLQTFTRQYIQAQRVPEATFAWQGGEPMLMGVDFFRRAVELQHRYRRPGMRVSNAMQTNGTLLDDEWCRFFRAHEFLIGLSLDGPREVHDVYRHDKGGRGTFDRVMAGLALLKKHKVDYNILACVNAVNAEHPLEVYRFFRDEAGAQFIQFIPIVERVNETGFQEGEQVTKRSVSGRQYGQFLTGVFDEWVRRDVGRTYVQAFDVALAAWTGQRPPLCIFEPECGRAMALEHNGDLYSCDHYVEPRQFLGNVVETPLVELVLSEKQLAFGEAKQETLPQVCLDCDVRFVCNGGCPKNRILAVEGEGRLLNILCEGYQAFFRHIDGPMRYMASELAARRPPAGIMAEMAPRSTARGARTRKTQTHGHRRRGKRH